MRYTASDGAMIKRKPMYKTSHMQPGTIAAANSGFNDILLIDRAILHFVYQNAVPW